MKRAHLLLLSCLLTLAVGCGDDPSGGGGDAAADGGDGGDGGSGDGGSGGGSGTGSMDGTGGSAGQCGDGGGAEPIYDPPGECFNNAMCASCNCRTYRDAPPDAGAACIDDQTEAMVLTATVLSFPDQQPLAAVDAMVINAFDIVTTGIENAVPLAEATSAADGRIDATLSETPSDQIGIIAVVQGDGYRATATGLAKPPYEPSNAIHDLFVVAEAQLTTYSDALAAEPALAEFLPLGDAGGVVGLARNRYTGEPMAGIQIVSLTNGDATQAQIRYLQDDGTFASDATGPSGVYVILDPALAEEFEATLDGQVVSTRANKAGSGAPGIFTMNMSIDVDPGSDPFG